MSIQEQRNCVITSTCIREINEAKGTFLEKVRDFSKFSSRSFIADSIQVDWDEIYIARGTDDINKIFSSFIISLSKLETNTQPF